MLNLGNNMIENIKNNNRGNEAIVKAWNDWLSGTSFLIKVTN